jgi:hypothetical protein
VGDVDNDDREEEVLAVSSSAAEGEAILANAEKRVNFGLERQGSTLVQCLVDGFIVVVVCGTVVPIQ